MSVTRFGKRGTLKNELLVLSRRVKLASDLRPFRAVPRPRRGARDTAHVGGKSAPEGLREYST